jgi:subtilisin family serine protease
VIKVLDPNAGFKDSSDSLLDALDFVEKHNIDVVNMSFGKSDVHEEIVERIRDLTTKNVVFVASAGNDGPLKSSATTPCNVEQVICVGMLDTSFSDINRKSSFGMNTDSLTSGLGFSVPDVLLPGEDLFSLDGDAFGKCKNGTGTSYAAPLLSALIADGLSAIKRRESSHALKQI